MSPPPTDAEYSEFVASTWGPLYRTAYLLVGDHGLAEDIVQTALMNTYASWHRVRDKGAVHGYARTAVVHGATSWFRTRARRPELVTAQLPDAPTSVDLADRPAVIDALRALPPRQRAVVVLRFYEDLTVAQTAEVLRCGEGTVKSQTSAALAKLRVQLGDAVVPAEGNVS